MSSPKTGFKALVLAAGYGTRLTRDIDSDTVCSAAAAWMLLFYFGLTVMPQSGQFTAIRGLPKPLVPVGSRPLITHWLQTLTANGLQVRLAP